MTIPSDAIQFKSKIFKTALLTTTTKRLNQPNFFPDFYDSYDYNTDEQNSSVHLFGLFPSDYDSGLIYNNDSYFLGNNKSGEPLSITSQLSAPLMYILCMLVLYLIIITVSFMSALYSHRKRVGYNFDDSVEYFNQSDESSDENQLLDPELERLNVINETNQEFQCNRSFDSESVDRDSEVYMSSSPLLIENKDFEFKNLTKSVSKFETRKLDQFFKRFVKSNIQITRNKRKKKLKKKRHERLSYLFLKKFVKLFPAASFNTQESAAIDEAKIVYDTEMEITRNKANPQGISHATTHNQPLLLSTSWNDENEL